MKNIKNFKYKSSNKFEDFLNAYSYKLEDVKGFSLSERKQYNNNVLKEYCIYFKDDEHEYFKFVSFTRMLLFHYNYTS